jgi:hypothetical protein
VHAKPVQIFSTLNREGKGSKTNDCEVQDRFPPLLTTTYVCERSFSQYKWPRNLPMYAITGITGKVGGALARTILAADQSVRAVVRNAEKGRSWAGKGCEVALAEMEDAKALVAAFKDVEGVLILPPSEFDPAPGFP